MKKSKEPCVKEDIKLQFGYTGGKELICEFSRSLTEENLFNIPAKSFFYQVQSEVNYFHQ